MTFGDLADQPTSLTYDDSLALLSLVITQNSCKTVLSY